MRQLRCTGRAVRGAAASLLVLAGLVWGGGARAGSPSNNPNYVRGDLLYVVYSPAGNELIVDIGPKANFDAGDGLCTTTWSSILQASDVTQVLGPLTPSTCFYSFAACNSDQDCRSQVSSGRDKTDFCVIPRVAIFGVRDGNSLNSYYGSGRPLTNFPLTRDVVGSGRGAANVADAFGLFANAYAPAVPSVRPNQARWAFGNEFSYQRIGNGVEDTNTRDNARHDGSLGSTIPDFNAGNLDFDGLESIVPVNASASTVINLPLRYGTLDPRDASTLAYGNVGFFEVNRDGVITRYCPDRDGDGIPNDGTDKCPGVSGSGVDADGDGFGTACDCNDASNTVWAVPVEIAGLQISRNGGTGQLTVSWASQDAATGTATNYDVARGLLSTLHATGFSTGATCASNNLADTPYTEAAGACATAGGDGCWYLVRGQNTCATATYGHGTNAADTLDGKPGCP